MSEEPKKQPEGDGERPKIDVVLGGNRFNVPDISDTKTDDGTDEVPKTPDGDPKEEILDVTEEAYEAPPFEIEDKVVQGEPSGGGQKANVIPEPGIDPDAHTMPPYMEEEPEDGDDLWMSNNV